MSFKYNDFAKKCYFLKIFFLIAPSCNGFVKDIFFI